MPELPSTMSPEAQLLYAAWSGDVPRVQSLLAQGIVVDVRDGRGRTPLMLALIAGNPEIVRLLLEAGADVCTCNKGNRPLVDYVSSAAVAKLILEHLSPQQRGLAATRLLFRVPSEPELLQCALAAGAKVNARNRRADSPLICHCRGNPFSSSGRACVQLLLAAGAYPHVLNSHEHSPMLMALWQDDAKMVELLLSAGVSPNVRLNKRGEQPLHHAYSDKVARVLVAAGADVNATDVEGYTPLMMVQGKNAELVRFLLQAGADVNACNAHGSVLAHICDRSEEVAQVLREAGAHYSVDNPNDWECAVRDSDIGWLSMLIDEGLDVNCLNERQETLLAVAAWNGQAEALRLLLAAGAAATLNVRDTEEGVTALHAAVIACRTGTTACPENVAALLAAGADVNLPDRDGWTPLHSCAFYHLPELVPSLLKAGALPHLRDAMGKSPADIAAEKGYVDVLRLLEEA